MSTEEKKIGEVLSPFTTHVIETPEAIVVQLQLIGDGSPAFTLCTVAKALVTADEPETAEAFATLVRAVVATAQRQALTDMAESAAARIILPN